MNNNPLLFFTKNDVPFEEAKLIIHTPSINEISMIGEGDLRIACQVILNLPQQIKSQGNFNSEDVDDFDIFIEILNQKESVEAMEYKNIVLKFFTLIFPNSLYRIRQKDIQIIQNIQEQTMAFIEKSNFNTFKEIIEKMFVSEEDKSQAYNPADGMAAKIAEKLKKGKNKKGNDLNIKNISLYRRYASILSVGLKLDLNVVLNYSIVQIEDQFKRFILNEQWHSNFSARMAGATGLDDPEDWMKEI